MDPLLSNREALMARLRPVLEARPEVVFALLFGSVARGQATPLSDVDVGIYTEQPLELLELGGLVNELEQVAGCSVDVVELREALERRPALAYEAVAQGKLICCRDEDRWVDFKCRTFLTYFDTEPLRRMIRGKQVDSLSQQRRSPVYRLVRMFREKVVTRLGMPVQVILFGSHARGEASATSDIDVLVVVPHRNEQVEALIGDIAWELGFEAGYVLSVVPVGRDEIDRLAASPFFQAVQREGIVL